MESLAAKDPQTQSLLDAFRERGWMGRPVGVDTAELSSPDDPSISVTISVGWEDPSRIVWATVNGEPTPLPWVAHYVRTA